MRVSVVFAIASQGLYNRRMHVRVILALAIWTAASLVPADAEDQMIDASACNLFCKVWRNVTGKAQVSSEAPIDNAERPSEPLPAATAGAERPDPNQVVAQRGVVTVPSPSERAAILKRKRALQLETTKVIASGESLMSSVRSMSGGAPAKER